MPCSHKVTPPWSRAAQAMEIQEGADGVEAAVTPSAGRLRLQEGQRRGGDAFFPYLFEGGSRKVSPWVMPIFCSFCSAASLQVVMLSPSLTPSLCPPCPSKVCSRAAPSRGMSHSRTENISKVQTAQHRSLGLHILKTKVKHNFRQVCTAAPSYRQNKPSLAGGIKVLKRNPTHVWEQDLGQALL